MAKLQRVLVVLSLFIAPVLFAQSADQEVVSVVDSPDPVTPGATLSYTVTLRNNGPNPAVNGGLNINLSGALTHTTDVVPAGWTCFWAGSNGTCNTPSFAAGTTEILTINATVGAHLANFADQTISSTFFPSGTTPDPNNANNSKQSDTLVDSPQVDLSVSATDSPDPVFPDGNVTYNVTVTNGGPDTASTVNFNVVPNSSLRFVSSTQPAGWSCTFPSVGAVNATFTCSRATWAPGSSNFVVVFSANDEQFGINDTPFQTFFGVNAGGSHETDNPDNTTTVTTQYTTPDADVYLTVADSPDPVSPDGNITYTVTVGNNGPDTAPNITLNSFGANNLRFVSASVPAGWNCTLPAAGTQTTSYSCTLASMTNGDSDVLTFVMQADDALIGNADTTIMFGYSANSTITDPVNGNNSETESTAYDVANANLGVTAADAPDPVAAGSNITYSGTVTNVGPDAATTVTFTIPLSPSLLFVSMTGPAGFSCATPAVGANGTITCTIASLPNAAALPYTLVVQTNPTLNNGPDGVIEQGFLIGAATNDPVLTNNEVEITTAYTTPDADLSTTNTDAPDPVTTGGTITYTQTITNNGPQAAVNATFTQSTPAGTTFQSLAASAGWTCATPAAGATGAINCSKASMTSGEIGTFTLVVNVTAGSGPIGSTVTADSDTYDPDPLDNTTTASTTVAAAASADLSVTKTTPATTAPAGSTITYTISVSNAGPDAATNVVMTDVLPASLLFQSITTPAGFTCTTPAAGTNGTITCNAATLASGVTRTFTLVVRVASGSTSGSATNTASVSSATGDPNGGNSSGAAPAVVLAPASADLSITKTTPTTTATSGSTITYTITVSNAGPSPATSVVVNDTLPAGLQFVSATPSQGTCNASSPVTCNLGTINTGASATITLNALVTATTGTISNTATVDSADDDPDAGDTTASSAPVPVVGAELSAVPTLSEWALMALAAMLGLVAVVKMRA